MPIELHLRKQIRKILAGLGTRESVIARSLNCEQAQISRWFRGGQTLAQRRIDYILRLAAVKYVPPVTGEGKLLFDNAHIEELATREPQTLPPFEEK